MKKLLLLLLLLLPLVTAQLEPKSIGSAVTSVELNWDIDLNDQSPQSASFTSFAFHNIPTQTVSFSTSVPYTASTNSFGNNLLTFELNPSQRTQRITMQATVTSNSLGGVENVNEDLSRYLQPSAFVLITPSISAKAREIIGSEVNPLKKATLLTSWVHNNVEYDLAYQDSILSSQQVFEIRRGVCNEYSHLLIAMLREVGIPSRFVAGFVYSGEIWAPHAWVEIAVNGKWYPFDPTYNEGILLDGTHLKFANGVDQGDVTEQFTARGNVDLSRVSLLRSHSVSFITFANFSNPPVISVYHTKDAVAANSIQNISISIKSTSGGVVAYPLALDVPPEVKILTEKSTLLFMFPGEEKNYSWQILIPADLREGYIYTYPLIVRSLGISESSLIQAKRDGDGGQTLARIDVQEVRTQGDKLLFSIKNIGNTNFTNAIAAVEFDSTTREATFSLGAGEETVIQFSVGQLNLSRSLQGELLITAENYSFSQPFQIQSTARSEPTRPAFNIQAAKAVVVSESLFEEVIKNKDLLVYLSAILLIIFFAIIINKMRS